MRWQDVVDDKQPAVGSTSLVELTGVQQMNRKYLFGVETSGFTIITRVVKNTHKVFKKVTPGYGDGVLGVKKVSRFTRVQ